MYSVLRNGTQVPTQDTRLKIFLILFSAFFRDRIEEVLTELGYSKLPEALRQSFSLRQFFGSSGYAILWGLFSSRRERKGAARVDRKM